MTSFKRLFGLAIRIKTKATRKITIQCFHSSHARQNYLKLMQTFIWHVVYHNDDNYNYLCAKTDIRHGSEYKSIASNWPLSKYDDTKWTDHVETHPALELDAWRSNKPQANIQLFCGQPNFDQHYKCRARMRIICASTI